MVNSDHGSPYTNAAESGFLLAMQARSDDGVDTIGADEHVTTNLFAGGKSSRHPVVVLLNPHAFVVEVNDSVTNPISKNVLEIRSVNADSCRHVSFSRKETPWVEFVQDAPIGGLDFALFDGRPRLHSGFSPTELVDSFEPIPPKSQAGTDFA